ncbi:MAG: hypothetical protein ACXWCX_03730 [Burkholderiales bacterium]
MTAENRRTFAQRRLAQLKVCKEEIEDARRAVVLTTLAARRAEKELAESKTSGEFVGSPRISDYYTAQVTITVTLTRAEADALRSFLTRTPPRESALGCAWGVIADALDDKGI